MVPFVLYLIIFRQQPQFKKHRRSPDQKIHFKLRNSRYPRFISWRSYLNDWRTTMWALKHFIGLVSYQWDRQKYRNICLWLATKLKVNLEHENRVLLTRLGRHKNQLSLFDIFIILNLDLKVIWIEKLFEHIW